MGSRRKSREMAIQILYQMDVNGMTASEAIPFYRHLLEANKKLLPFAEELVKGVEDRRIEIDRLIQKHSKNWRIDRMAWVDRNILRLAVYELVFLRATPPKVALNEAIDLGKKFGTSDSSSFINGILDSIHQQLKSEELNEASSEA